MIKELENVEKILELEEIREIWEGELDIDTIKALRRALIRTEDPNFRVVEWDRGAEHIFYKDQNEKGNLVHPRKFEYKYSVYFLVCNDKEVYEQTFGKIEEEKKKEETSVAPAPSYPKVKIRVRWKEFHGWWNEISYEYYTDAPVYNIHYVLDKTIPHEYRSIFGEMLDAIETRFGKKGLEKFEEELMQYLPGERVEIETVKDGEYKGEKGWHLIYLEYPIYILKEGEGLKISVEELFEKFDSLVRKRINNNDKSWLED